MQDSLLENRRFQRLRVRIPTRLLISKTVECSAMVIVISAGNLSFYSKGPLREGDEIIAYVRGIDRFEGIIMRRIGNVFGMRLSLSSLKREKLIERLMLEAAYLDGVVDRYEKIPERRRNFRKNALDRKSLCITNDERSYPCEVVDISLTGLAARIPDADLVIGEIVQIGRMMCRVVRKTETGYGFEIREPARKPIQKDKPETLAIDELTRIRQIMASA